MSKKPGKGQHRSQRVASQHEVALSGMNHMDLFRFLDIGDQTGTPMNTKNYTKKAKRRTAA